MAKYGAGRLNRAIWNEHLGLERTLEYEDVVEELFACPECEEAGQDHLVWDDNVERVTCQACGCVYAPSRE